MLTEGQAADLIFLNFIPTCEIIIFLTLYVFNLSIWIARNATIYSFSHLLVADRVSKLLLLFLLFF